MSLGPGGVPGNGDSTGAILTTGARYVGFSSLATNLVVGDGNGHWDAFVATERVSVSSSGLEGNGDSFLWSLSQGGRYAVIVSDASNLVSGDTNGVSDVFIRDRRSGTTSLISAGLDGAPADGGSFGAVISSDGKFVALQSQAADLVPDGKNGHSDIFLRNLRTGATTLVSTDSRGKQGDGDSYDPSLSADGRFVTFTSYATNLMPGDTNGFSDIFVHDRLTGRTERVSVSSRGTQGEGGSFFGSISADGRFVAFDSSTVSWCRATATTSDVFLRDRDRGTTRLLSVGPSGVEGNQLSESPRISADGAPWRSTPKPPTWCRTTRTTRGTCSCGIRTPEPHNAGSSRPSRGPSPVRPSRRRPPVGRTGTRTTGTTRSAAPGSRRWRPRRGRPGQSA